MVKTVVIQEEQKMTVVLQISLLNHEKYQHPLVSTIQICFSWITHEKSNTLSSAHHRWSEITFLSHSALSSSDAVSNDDRPHLSLWIGHKKSSRNETREDSVSIVTSTFHLDRSSVERPLPLITFICILAMIVQRPVQLFEGESRKVWGAG